MKLSGILAISGHPGLFRMVGQMKNGLLVESLIDGKRMPAYATHRILALEDISIYTEDGDVPLGKVLTLLAAKHHRKPTMDPKNAKTEDLQAALAEVLPEFDRERVYASDLRKLFQWYNLLAEKELLFDEEEESPAETDSTESEKKTS